MIKIGVFDSGVGGKSVVEAIKKRIPDAEIVYATDQANIPYGGKTPETLAKLAIPKIKTLEDEGCQVIVVACNTVTTTIIEQVRESVSVPVVAIEPMIKPACEMSKTKKIVVCATPATLKSFRYRQLLDMYAQQTEVFEPDCSDWARLIEHNKHNIDSIETDLIEPLKKGADVIVLACTHYHWIEDEIAGIAKLYNASVIQPEDAIVNRLKTVISQL
jgi:glutamate racemase